MGTVDRRSFLGGAASLAGLTILSSRARGSANRVGVALLGCGRRGTELLGRLLGTAEVGVVAVCDPSAGAREAAARAVADKAGRAPAAEADLRRVLERDDVDAVVVATPNHWHALATIWACQAGRDAWVETPACWSLAEGEAMLAARGGRIVQVAHEQRGDTALRDAVARARAGQVGPLYMARGICYELREPLPKVADTAAPAGLDWELWQGPARRRPFNEAYLRGWPYFWDFGGGEMGQSAAHQVDTARWFLDKSLPVSLFSSGGRYLSQPDAGETPNIQHTTFTFDDGLPIVMEVRGRPSNDEAGVKTGNLVYGNQGYMAGGDGYQPHIGYKGDGKPPENLELKPVGGSGEPDLLTNWLAAIRTRRREDLNCELEQGVRSAQLCCLANISYRLLRAVDFDPAAMRFVNDAEAQALAARADAPRGFTLPG